jgi:hypothetical protein
MRAKRGQPVIKNKNDKRERERGAVQVCSYMKNN